MRNTGRPTVTAFGPRNYLQNESRSGALNVRDVQEDALYAEEPYEDYGDYEEQYVDPGQPSVQGDKGRPSPSLGAKRAPHASIEP
jgi:hypothetical protein